MNIVYAVQYYPPHTGGLEKVAHQLAERAAAAGHTVHVITFALPGQKPGTVREGQVTVHRVRGWHIFDQLFGIPFCVGGIGMLRTLWRTIRTADVVHVHDVFYLTSLTSYLIARWHKKPVFISQHVAVVKHGTLVMLAERCVYALWGRPMLRGAQMVLVHQDGVRDFVRMLGVSDDRVRLVRIGVDLTAYVEQDEAERRREREQYSLPLDRPLVLFVGRFVPKKGHQVLFDARDAAYQLVFVGSGEVPDSWQTTPGVHVLGSLSPHAVARLMPAVDVVAAPSTGETWTLVMQEALACGVPLVIGDAPAYAAYELDRERIVLCPPTAPSLQHELKRIVSDPALKERMGAYGRELAARYFDWEKNGAEMVALYTQSSLQRTPNNVPPTVVTSWDDGHVLDKKMAALLTQHGVKGTFYVAPQDHELASEERLTPEQARTLSTTHEIGAHTVHHQHLTTLGDAEAAYEIEESKRVLEGVIGTPVTSFCYPAGKYAMRHVKMVERAGFTNARTVKRFATSLRRSMFELPTSIHTYDHWLDVWGVLKLARFRPLRFFYLYRHWDRQAKALFDRVQREGGVFHLWGHSEEVERHGDWDRLKEVLQYIGGREGVAYSTVSEAAELAFPQS